MQKTATGAAAVGPRRDRSLHGQLVDALGAQIAAAPSDPSPLDPVQIAAEHSVSRTVVRETLRTLAAKGMVEARPNTGTRVRPVGEWNLLDPQVIAWRAAGPDAGDQTLDLEQIKIVLEPLIEHLAARRGKYLDPPVRDRIAGLAAVLTDAAQAADADRFAEADLEFHTLLASVGGNEVLAYLAGLLYRHRAGRALCPHGPEGAAEHAALARDVLAGRFSHSASVALSMQTADGEKGDA